MTHARYGDLMSAGRSTPTARRFDVLALGEPMLEFNQRPGADDAPTYVQGFGGDTSNVAIAAARQGARAGYVSRVGTDAFGERLVALWQREGVDIEHVARVEEAPTGIYFVSHDERGHHFSYYRAGSAASRLSPEHVPQGAIASAHAVHVSGISQAISVSACDAVFCAIEAARGAGTLVSYDPNVRPTLWPAARARAIALETIAQVDVCLPSLEDATILFGERAVEGYVDLLLARGARLVALKLGRDGALVATAEERHHVPGFAVESVDATGAGDTFDGAFLTERVRGATPMVAARYANAAAALATRGYGAVDPIPRRAEVERFLSASARAPRR